MASVELIPIFLLLLNAHYALGVSENYYSKDKLSDALKNNSISENQNTTLSVETDNILQKEARKLLNECGVEMTSEENSYSDRNENTRARKSKNQNKNSNFQNNSEQNYHDSNGHRNRRNQSFNGKYQKNDNRNNHNNNNKQNNRNSNNEGNNDDENDSNDNDGSEEDYDSSDKKYNREYDNHNNRRNNHRGNNNEDENDNNDNNNNKRKNENNSNRNSFFGGSSNYNDNNKNDYNSNGNYHSSGYDSNRNQGSYGSSDGNDPNCNNYNRNNYGSYDYNSRGNGYDTRGFGGYGRSLSSYFHDNIRKNKDIGILRYKRSDTNEEQCISQCVFGYLQMLDDDRFPSETLVIKWLQERLQNDMKRIKTLRDARKCFGKLSFMETKDGCEYSKSLSNCLNLDLE